MKKNDLKNGDIVVLRSGLIGAVILKESADESYILYSEAEGFDYLDSFDEDMIYTLDAEDVPDAVMLVYQEEGAISFLDFEDYDPVYVRDTAWRRPTKEEMEEARKKKEEEWKQLMVKADKEQEKKKIDLFYVIAQAFYGNRTGVEIERSDIGVAAFLSGCTSIEHYDLIKQPVDVRMIRVPDTDNLVIVYDQIQEDKYVNEDFPRFYSREAEDYRKHTGRELTMYVTCSIPEIDVELHTRCFACRIDENGQFQDLEQGDAEKFIHYFTR